MKESELVKCLKLPFKFDRQQLVSDLEKVLQGSWKPHFVVENYEGEWNSLALYAPGGDAHNIFAMGADQSPIKPTTVMQECHYFQEVLDYFDCPFLSVRLLRLGPGAVIKPHRDYALGYEDDVFRLHIPIETNANVHFILDEERLVLQPGECWYTNVNFVHSVSNLGKTARVHLVIDGVRNDWSDKIFFSLAPEARFFPVKEETHSMKAWKAIKKELERGDAEINQSLIADINERLKQWQD